MIIRLVRKAQNTVITDGYFRNLIHEKLLTLLKNAGLLLNCRPLARVSPDPEDWCALTSMALLNGCMDATLPKDGVANLDGLHALYRDILAGFNSRHSMAGELILAAV